INLTIGLKEEVSVEDNDRRVSTEASSGASALVLTGAELNVLSDDPDQLAADLQALVGVGGPDVAQFNVDGFDGGKLPPTS
ncbi:MAG: hypothetical protein WAW17_23375, partial [Rhodococcus sp. (in: high G+C Gram-positive bacteria)]|uniref:hypothetical protein n=1 Tax=Rhodococcus sp. TaxID=1831 RepID=UPI003BB17081